MFTVHGKTPLTNHKDESLVITFRPDTPGEAKAQLRGSVDGGLPAARATAEKLYGESVPEYVEWGPNQTAKVNVQPGETVTFSVGHDAYVVRFTTQHWKRDGATCVIDRTSTATLTPPVGTRVEIS